MRVVLPGIGGRSRRAEAEGAGSNTTLAFPRGRRDDMSMRTTARVATWGGEWDWTMDLTPPFALEGTTVANFLGWVSTESGLEVRYATPATEQRAKQTTLHGSVGNLHPDVAAKLRDGPASILRKLIG